MKQESNEKYKSLQITEELIKKKFSQIEKLEEDSEFENEEQFSNLLLELIEDLKQMTADLIFSSDEIKEFYQPTIKFFKQKTEELKKKKKKKNFCKLKKKNK